ncbi:MAG: hypothetical protein M0Z66_12490 [Thermaerobacter sp.]|nr:hypothetical protein [Thermaerobacter sp.]
MQKGILVAFTTLISANLLLMTVPQVAMADPGTYALCSPSSFMVSSSTDIEWDYSQGHDTIITASGPSGTFTIYHQYYPASSENQFIWYGTVNNTPNGTPLQLGTYTVTITPNDSDRIYAKSTSCTLLPYTPPPPPSQPPVPFNASWKYPPDPKINYLEPLLIWNDVDVDYSVMSPPSDFVPSLSAQGLSLSAGTDALTVSSDGSIESTIPTSQTTAFKYGTGTDPMSNFWFGWQVTTSILSGTVFSGDIQVLPKTHLAPNRNVLAAVVIVAVLAFARYELPRLGPEAGPVLQYLWYLLQQLFKLLPDFAYAPPATSESEPIPFAVRRSLAVVEPTPSDAVDSTTLIDQVLGQGADQLFSAMPLSVPATLYNGQTFQFAGSGYGPGDPVSVWSGPIDGLTLQTTVRADSGGRISGSFQLPQDAKAGSWYVFAVDNNQVANNAQSVLNDASTLQIPLGVGSFDLVTDTTPPAVRLDVLPGSPSGQRGWYNTPVTVGVIATDAQSGVDQVEISLDGGKTFAPYTGPVTLTNGVYGVMASAVDYSGNQGTSPELVLPVDTVPPTTAASGVPTGWVNHAVQVGFIAQDNLSGVQGTYVGLDGLPVQEATALTISTEGYHTITYWSEDNAGNIETPHYVIVPIDLTPPIVQGTTNIAPNAKGWFRTDVTVEWNATDPPLIDGHAGSGVAEVSPPVTVTQEGKGIVVTGQATDNAGNVGTGEVSLNIDKTPPTITISEPQGSTYLDDQILTPSFSAADSLSGVDTVEASVYGQAATNGEAIQLWQLPLGQVPFTVTASDNAGNIANQTVTFTVTTSLTSMEDLVGRFTSMGLITDHGLAESLTAKLRAAEAAQSRGDLTAAANELGAFVNEVNAQAGKGIAPVVAAVLLRDTQYVLNTWEG